MSYSRFDRNTFESVEFLLDGVEIPKIKASGSSSSNVLNRYMEALSQDMALLATRTNILAARSARLATGVNATTAALQAAFQAVSSRVDAASGYSQVLADMHSSFYVNSGSTTATINNIYGQATLPVLSESDLLVQTDVYGNKYVSSEIQWLYSNKAGTVASLSIGDFNLDPEGIYMLRDEQLWVRSSISGQTQAWIRLKAPIQFRGLTPNVLDIDAFPPLITKLKAVYYRETGDAEDTWTSVDLSYCPLYSSTTGQVDMFSSVRLHLPSVSIVEIMIHMDVSAVSVWGIKRLKLYHREYDSSATLVVKDPYSRNIGDVILRGKDASVLSSLTITKAANEASIALTTTDSSYTPVINAAIMSVN